MFKALRDFVYYLPEMRMYGNKLPVNARYLGFKRFWYDGWFFEVGFWWGHFYWTA